MGHLRLSLILMLLPLQFTGCSTSPKQEKPLTAEETYERIRDIFLNRSVLRFVYWTDNRPKETEPGSAVIASGNRIRISPRIGSSDGVFASNGDQAVYDSKVGSQPLVSTIPPDLERILKKDLLRGLFSPLWILSPWKPRQGGHISYMDVLPEHKVLGHFALGTDESGHSTLSALVYRNENDSYPVHFRYDSQTFGLIYIESHPPHERYRATNDIVIEVLEDLPISDDLFRIPEDPLIKIKRTDAELALICDALERYLLDNHAYPTTVQSLDALLREPVNPRPLKWKGPYLKGMDLVVDPWGNPYSYRSPRPGINPQGYDLWSWGYDGRPGTRDDIYANRFR